MPLKKVHTVTVTFKYISQDSNWISCCLLKHEWLSPVVIVVHESLSCQQLLNTLLHVSVLNHSCSEHAGKKKNLLYLNGFSKQRQTGDSFTITTKDYKQLLISKEATHIENQGQLYKNVNLSLIYIFLFFMIIFNNNHNL